MSEPKTKRYKLKPGAGSHFTRLPDGTEKQYPGFSLIL
jgi:hypothetical protein